MFVHTDFFYILQLPGTIYTAAKEIEAAGGAALPCIVDVRDEEQVQASIEQVRNPPNFLYNSGDFLSVFIFTKPFLVSSMEYGKC